MELREIDFDDLVLDSDRPVLVDFWASWCPPCKMMQPVIEKLSVKVSDWADVYSVNIDRNPSLASRYQISGVPTFVAFAGGQPIERKTGALTENQLTALLKKALEAVPALPEQDLDESWEAGEERDDHVQNSAEVEAAVSTTESIIHPLTRTESTSTSFITIVSGLPRSGTSLMMRMLNVGGIPALCDEHRTPDADNPNGYYEFESVKSIQNYGDWIDRAVGHSVKMVYNLLEHLPKDREYRVVFMRRHIDEIIQSQRAMLLRNGINTEIPDEEIKELFERVLRQFYSWLPSQTHLRLINVSYNELLSRPSSTISQINRHLGYCLDTEAMAQVIDHSLYRNRAA